MTIVLGLTGGIATGKSTVAALFKKENIPVVDADLISRQVVEPGEVAYQGIRTAFGEEIILEDQSINRKRLAELIFNDQEKRAQLNKLVHPVIIDQIIKERDVLVEAAHPIIVLDIPLLFELKLTNLVDQTIVVYTPPEVQLTRLKKRDGLTDEEAKKRIDSQMSIEDKVKLADMIIDNSGPIKQTEAKLYELLDQFE